VLGKLDAGFDDLNAFAFEQTSLQRCVRLADENPSVVTDDAMPGNALTGRARRHGAASRACATRQAQNSRHGSIGKNPAAGDLFYEVVDGLPGHRCSADGAKWYAFSTQDGKALLVTLEFAVLAGPARHLIKQEENEMQAPAARGNRFEATL
jgi:hypothetical protein